MRRKIRSRDSRRRGIHRSRAGWRLIPPCGLCRLSWRCIDIPKLSSRLVGRVFESLDVFCGSALQVPHTAPVPDEAGGAINFCERFATSFTSETLCMISLYRVPFLGHRNRHDSTISPHAVQQILAGLTAFFVIAIRRLGIQRYRDRRTLGFLFCHNCRSRR